MHSDVHLAIIKIQILRKSLVDKFIVNLKKVKTFFLRRPIIDK